MSWKHVAPLTLLILVGCALQQSHAAGLLKCNGPNVDIRKPEYNISSTIRNTTIGAFGDLEIRVNVMVAAVGIYRSENGASSLRAGMTFKMIYKDGTRECGAMTSGGSSITAVPIDDTQRDGQTLEVEDTSVYIQQFRPIGMGGIHGTYQICYDYFSNCELTTTQCTAHVW